MTTYLISSSRALAAVAGLGLVLSALAPMAMAQTTTTTTTTSTTATFTRDLTIGSTGADVTALQNWLISKGHSIAAGATGYFGTQTKAALAAYQAANGISPAAGYFGPITRAKTLTTSPSPEQPKPEDDESEEDEDEDEVTEKEARAAVQDAKDDLEEAEDAVDDSDARNQEQNDAEDILEDAEDLINDAEDRIWDKDYDEAMDVLDEVADLIEEALEIVGEEKKDDSVSTTVESSAEVREQDGADNDFADFEMKLKLTAKGNDVFLSRSLSTAFDFEVEKGNGDAVSAGTITGLLQSSADLSGNYYRIEEGEQETFTITVTFDPAPSDEGGFFTLQLLSVNFAQSATSPDIEFSLTPENRYQTNPVYIAD